MKTLAITLLLAAIAAAQSGTPVRPTDDPSPNAIQKVLVVSGTNTVAVCSSPSTLSSRSGRIVSISAASNANPVSLTSTSHGFDSNSLPTITISGGTGNWTAVNGTWVATITSANAFTIPVDSTSLGALTGTLVFTTTAPRKTVAEWSVQKIAYDGSNNPIWIGWLGGATSYSQKCSDYASTTITAQ